MSLADVDTSATRTPSHVVSLDQALQLKKDFADTYFPELEYLGDFHSHPYETKDVKTELAVERKTLQERSSADTAWVKDIQKTESTHRLSLITTIFERDNPVARQEGHVNGDRSCLRFRYDSMTVWIKVYVFQMSQTDRKHRKVACKKVAVVCPSIGVHVGTLNV